MGQAAGAAGVAARPCRLPGVAPEHRGHPVTVGTAGCTAGTHLALSRALFASGFAQNEGSWTDGAHRNRCTNLHKPLSRALQNAQAAVHVRPVHVHRPGGTPSACGSSCREAHNKQRICLEPSLPQLAAGAGAEVQQSTRAPTAGQNFPCHLPPQDGEDLVHIPVHVQATGHACTVWITIRKFWHPQECHTAQGPTPGDRRRALRWPPAAAPAQGAAAALRASHRGSDFHIYSYEAPVGERCNGFGAARGGAAPAAKF